MATLRLIHIGAGMIALFVAPGAMLTVKGGSADRRWGKLYFWTMAVVALTAVILAVGRPNVFLLLAVFSSIRPWRAILAGSAVWKFVRPLSDRNAWW